MNTEIIVSIVSAVIGAVVLVSAGERNEQRESCLVKFDREACEFLDGLDRRERALTRACLEQGQKDVYHCYASIVKPK